jgi:hypothetical protein
MVLALWRGDTAAVVDAIGDFASQYPGHPGWWVSHALSLAAVGRTQEVREVLTRRSPDPDELINNPFPLLVISGLASASVYLHDAQLAARVAATLRPYRGYWAHGYSGVAGPVTFISHCAQQPPVTSTMRSYCMKNATEC